MTDPLGVCLLPASGEWVYDTLPRRAARPSDPAPAVVNLHAATTRTDYQVALDQLQAQLPGCRTVALVVAWFGSSTDVARCKVYPATTFVGGTTEALVNDAWQAEPWRCSGLTQASPGLIPLSADAAGNVVYGGTPSDPSVVRCLRDLRARGLRTVFYPFLLMDAPGYPWRGRIGLAGADRTVAARDAVASFLGSAAPSQFTRDAQNGTVGYAGAATDWTWRRMILHYANLCAVAGGVDLFLLGSELRGLEAMRGPGWTPGGTVADDGTASWDYPFVDGLGQLADDVRAVFDGANLARDAAGLHNLVGYSPDWSSWMGAAHADAGGVWPNLDQLWARPSIDLVAFDDYLPLSDWTGGDGGLDAAAWRFPGAPDRRSKSYLKSNIEGGQYFSWFYRDGTNRGRGPDPAGSAEQMSLPVGDRLLQVRTPYAAGQQLLAPKQLRWWWGAGHRATYDSGDGAGTVARGAPSRWVPLSKAIALVEYGFPSVDRCTNQPNVFYDPKSSESFTPYWSAWDPIPGDRWAPRRDDALAAAAREAVIEYWTVDGNNAASPAGVPMVQTAFCCAWNWDARPFPAFPASAAWGDGPNWAAGTWIEGKGGPAPPPATDTPPAAGPLPAFPTLAGQAGRATWRPLQTVAVAEHVSGRETRADRDAGTLWEAELAFDVLPAADLVALVGFYAARRGDALAFTLVPPTELGLGSSLPCRFAEEGLDAEEFAAVLAATRSVRLRSVK